MPAVDIVFVNPGNKKQMYGALGEGFAAIEPPVLTGLLAAFAREKGFSVAIIDADAENESPQETVEKITAYDPCLVAIAAAGANPSASSTPKMAAVRDVAGLLKRRRPASRIAVYGIHPSALPGRTLTEEPVDFVCRGEAFYPLTELAAIFKKGTTPARFSIKGLWHRAGEQIIDNGWAELVSDIDLLPFAAWDLLPMEKYRAHNWHCFGRINERAPYAVIFTSLGCPHNCRYCNIHALYSGKPGIRFRSPENVIKEVDFLVARYGVKNIKILDELFVVGGRRTDAICDLLIERQYGLNIWAYARVDTVDERILKKLYSAGVRWLCFGIEAADAQVRDKVAKGRFDVRAIRRAVELTRAAGIHVLGNFMFGLPDDTMETMRETLALAKELCCDYANFYSTMAYPGSQLYEDAVKHNIPLPKDWIGFSQLSPEAQPLPTRYVSAAEVLRFRDNAFDEYHSDPRYLAMIEKKFGSETVAHIKRMCAQKVVRAGT